MSTIWIILSVISLILLIKYFSTRNAVWGGLVMGLIVGVIWSFFLESGFSFIHVVKVSVSGVLIGFIFELLGKAGDRMRR